MFFNPTDELPGADCSARCDGCGAEVSWVGKVTDWPACPRCGWRPTFAQALAEQILRQSVTWPLPGRTGDMKGR